MKKKVLTLILAELILISSACGQIDEVSKKVMDDIDSIGEVELEDEDLINKIQSTYSTLTDNQKKQVSNYTVLLNAKDELEKLHEEQKKLQEKAKKAESIQLTAHSIKNSIDNFLTDIDTAGFGMYYKSEDIQIFDITIEDSEWRISAADPNLFYRTTRIKYQQWGSEGIGHKNDNKFQATNAESYFAIELSSVYPEITNGSIKASLQGGICIAIAFTEDKTTPLVEGVDCPDIVNGVFDNTFEWGEVEGLTKEGLLVGIASRA